MEERDKLIKQLADVYSAALKVAKSIDCNEVKALYNVPLKNMELIVWALEKQMPKKPIMKPYFEDMEEEYLCCPTCGEILTDIIPDENKNFYFHCLNCGQAFDWSDEE